jgi:adenylate cyclase
VTVLFADLSGFTSLSEHLDPEDVRALQNDLHREMADAVMMYDGFLEKFIGDAALAVFGAPTAHEDDPERALHTALNMCERIEAMSKRWVTRLGKPLTLHIGINTGPVVAGSIGTGEGTAYAVTGDTVNTAARLQSAASDDEILVGPTTHQLTRHLFTYEAAGEIALKGKDEPVAAYRLRGHEKKTSSGRALEAHGLSAPLIGRQHELKQMVDLFDRASDGRAQVVRLLGEAGVGKTRLLEEFIRDLDSSGKLDTVTVRRAATSSHGESTFGVLATLIRDGYAIAAGDTLEVAKKKLKTGLLSIGSTAEEAHELTPYLSYVLGLGSGEETFANLEPEQLKRQIFMAARSMFEHRLNTGPILMIVEDLHWADAASIELLRFLVDRLDERPLMLLLTHRPTFNPADLATSRTSQTAIRLGALTTDDCRDMVSGLFGAEMGQISEQVQAFLIERASGNPFYLEEVVRSLIEGGTIYHDGTSWACSEEVDKLDVPLTIQGLLLSRLDRLPDGTRRLAQEAAVLGVQFTHGMLKAVSSAPGTLDNSLDALIDVELVEEVRDTKGNEKEGGDRDQRFKFTHAIVHEVVYKNLLVSRRAKLHSLAGAALEKICGPDPERLEDVEALGHHFGHGDAPEKGVRYLVEAGDRARRLYANHDAIRHFRRAIECLDQAGDKGPRRFSILERLGDLLGQAGGREEALEKFEIVLGALGEQGDASGQARLYRKISNLLWETGARGASLSRIKAGLALLEGSGEEIELAHLYHEMGRLSFRSGNNDAAVEWAGKALDYAQPLLTRANGDNGARQEAAAVISEAHNTLGVAEARRDRPEDAVSEVEKSLEVAEAHDLFQIACRGYTNLSVLYSNLDPGRAIETCQRGLAIAKKIGDLSFQSRLYANLGVSYCTFTGRCEGEGVDAVNAAIDLDRELGLVDHLPVSLVVLGQIYQCHGEPQMAINLYKEALEFAEELDEPQVLFPCYDGLATVHLDIDDIETAEQYMDLAQNVCERAGLDPESLVVLPFLC